MNNNLSNSRTDKKADSAELALLSAITTYADLDEVRDNGLTSDDFQNPDHRRFFEYLLGLEQRGKILPSWEDKVELWSVDLPENHQDVHSLSKKVRTLSTARKAKAVLMRVVPDIDEDPELVLDKLQLELAQIKPANIKSRTSFYEEDALTRVQEIEKRAENRRLGKFIGIPTGLDIFDADGYGIQPGELLTVIGKSGVGKSWLLIHLCVSAYKAGYKVLYLSPEMSTLECELRIDVVMMHEDNVENVSHRGLISGNSSYIDSYRRWASDLEPVNRWVTIDSDKQGGFSVGTISDLVVEHKPDILAIDGFHLLAGSNSGQSWENVKKNADGIKALALLKGISVYNVTQSQRSVGAHENPELNNVAYGFSLVEASDKVASIGAVRAYPDKRMLKILKNRNGVVPFERVRLQFDVDAGHIEQLGLEALDDDDDYYGDNDF